jgi:O-antigen ligase
VAVVIGLVLTIAVLLLAGVKVPGLGRLHTVERLTGTTSSGRAEIWKTGLVACTLHCATGSGLGTFEFAYNESFALTSTAHNAGFNRPAHDIYLSLAVETGFLGLTLFLLAVLGEWAHFGRRALFQLSPGFRATIAGVLLANIFLSAIWFKYFWLPFVFGRVIEGAAASLQRDSGLEPVDQRSGDRLPMLTRPAKTR